MFVETVPELAEVPRSVPHRVRVLTEDDGMVEVVGRPRVEPVEGGIHRPDDVRHPLVLVGFVVDRPRRVALAGHCRHPFVIAPEIGLVPERPADDARMVLVALDHPHHPVDVGRLPGRVVAEVWRRAHLLQPVALQVRLVEDVEPVLVTEVVEPWVVRVVGRPDGVDVVALHQLDVLAHHGHGDGAAPVGVEVVAVDPTDGYGFAVDEELTALDRHVPKPDGLAHDGRGIILRHGQREVVSGRGLRRPAVGLLDDRLEANFLGRTGVERDGRPREVDSELRPVPVSEGRRDPCARSRLADVAHVGDASERPVLELVVGFRSDVHVANLDRRLRGQGDVPEDAAQPPHVLVFEVAAVGPLVDPDREGVLARRDRIGDVELGGEPTPLAVADSLAVHPDVERGVDAVELEPDPPIAPAVRDRERPTVQPGRVLGRDVRRVDRERIDDVGVVWLAVARRLPVSRNPQLVPVTVVEARVVKPVGCAIRRFDEREPPSPVQRAEPGRGGSVPRDRRLRVVVRHHGYVGVDSVSADNLRIQPVGDHVHTSRNG